MPRNLSGSTEQLHTLRVQLLSSCDWYSIRHRDQIDLKVPTALTEAQYGQLLSYRQQLRDWVSGAFPVKPDFIQ